jgi:hypothetical protein
VAIDNKLFRLADLILWNHKTPYERTDPITCTRGLEECTAMIAGGGAPLLTDTAQWCPPTAISIATNEVHSELRLVYTVYEDLNVRFHL